MLEVQQRASVTEKGAVGATYLSLRVFVWFIGVFNLFLFNICLICLYDNLQSIQYIVAINKRELPLEYTQKGVIEKAATSSP